MRYLTNKSCVFVDQVFVRQGSLIHLIESGNKKARTPRILKPEKEAVRQSFLFSNHLILTTRAANGRLHLVPHVGKIPLADATLIEVNVFVTLLLLPK